MAPVFGRDVSPGPKESQLLLDKLQSDSMGVGLSMIVQKEIPISDLLLDLENPRLAQGQQNQTEALHAMLRAEGPKTLALAESISKEGVSPGERLLVMPSEQDAAHFVVLEGNRRLVALKILADPTLATAVLTPAQQKNLAKWSTEYKKRGEVDAVECVAFTSREEANPWIERRHQGEQGGVGIVPWGATEAARFAARRSGKVGPELQVLDFVAQHGQLDETTREKLHNVPITNLDRLIADKAVRDKLGLLIDSDGRVLTKYPVKETLKGLSRVISDLANGKIKVSDIYTAKHRQDYLREFKASNLPTPSKALPTPVQLTGGGGIEPPPTATPGPTKKPAPAPKPRATLIPITCKLVVPVAKIGNIYRELKRLRLEDYPNAVSVLLRVFLELSVDAVIASKKLMTDQQLSGSKLRDKLVRVADYLKSQGKLNEQQVKTVKKAASDQHLIYASITTLHQYVHNQNFSASPADLRTSWDNLQFLFEAIWP